MKKTPKILPTYYKSKGTPIFRDTTALPFAVGGNINPTNPAKPSPKPSSKSSSPQVVYISNYPEYQYRQQRYLDSLSTVEGGAYRSLGYIPRAYTNIPGGKKTTYYPNTPNKFYTPGNQNSVTGRIVETFNPYKSLNISPTHVVSGPNRDPGAYSETFYLKFKAPVQKPVYKPPTPPKPSVKPNPNPVVPEEPVPVVPPKPEIMEKMEILDPDPITRKPLGSLVIPEFPAFPTYQMPGYMKQYEFPTIGWKTPLAAKAVQKATGYDRNLMEGYYDEEGNYVPGELQNAQEQNRAPQFVGASSFKDMLAQREYLKTLQQTRGYRQGGTIHFEPSEYGSDAREQYDDGGPIYTYSKRPGSYYQKTEDGWLINNSSTGGKYIPIDDPTGERAALLNKYAKPQPGINKIYADPLSRNSETTQAVAAKVMPQTKEQWQTYTAVQQGNQQRRSDIAKALELQGMTPEQATSTLASYGSDWPTLETAKARDIQIMNKTAADIQAGINPSSMQSFIPREGQSTLGRVRDITFNPFTSAGYALRGQDIPEYMGEKIDNGTLGYWSNGQFVEGRNALDTVTDTATPIGWAHSAYNIADKATNNKSGDFWTEENAWDALNTVPGIGLAAKGMKYTSLPSRLSIVPKSTAANLAVDAGSIAREPYYAPQRPNLLHLGISPEQQELLNLQQVNNTTMLSSVAPTRKLKFHGEDYRSPAGLPSYMEPTLYSQEEMARRMTPYQQALMKLNQTEKAADRIIQRTTDDKVYYDLDGNILKTPLDNY